MIRVMVVDDSALARKIAGDILNAQPEIEVVATAARAEFALAKLEREKPDVITMDMEMPGMNGVEAIREIMNRRPTPIVVLSAHARAGAELTLAALEAGAVDFVLKPSSSLYGGLDDLARHLVETVRGAVGAPTGTPIVTAPPKRRPVSTGTHGRRAPRLSSGGRFEIVAIGTSTGGPVALKEVLSGIPEDFPLPILVVQHMPPVFTRAFAERLNSSCPVDVKEAEEHDELIPGRVLIAPGDYHMIVDRGTSLARIHLHQREQVSGHRPSVDVLMHSVAREYGSKALAVIMTGMGRDGADGLQELHRRGGEVVAQDESTSVIYGMNREVISRGDADSVVPLNRIADAIMQRAFSAALS